MVPVPFFFAADVTAYFGVLQIEDRYQGTVDLLHGRDAIRVEHLCKEPRNTEAEALRDARREASALVRHWREGQRRGE